VYISAFLEATLRGVDGYLPLFADARVGDPWLPDTAYLIEFDDSRSTKVATFDEDVDVTTTTVAGGRTWAENLNVWREQRVSMKSRTKETAGVYLGWEVEEEEKDDELEERQDAEIIRRYVIELPADFIVDAAGTLFFSLADADESPSKPEHLREQDQEQGNGQDQDQAGAQGHDQQQAGGQQQEQQQSEADGDEDDESEEEEEPREPIDFTVRFIDVHGAVAELPLSRFSMVQPQLEVQLRKAFFEDPETESEAVFQSFVFPLRWFLEANPDLDPSRPARLELVFDRSAAGVVILDTVGFRPRFGV
jgi:hypothetical protein